MRHGDIATLSTFALTMAWASMAQAQPMSDCYDGGGIDLQDHQRLLPCLRGPGVLLNDPQCGCADLDGDGDSDLFDLGLFQLRFGEENPCGRSSGGCLASHGSPGCNDAACCSDVCATDPFCCNGAWDTRCVQTAMDQCGVLSALDNDCCETPTAVTDGTTAFSNVGAEMDGPVECGQFPRPGLEIYADIWFIYTATCTGLAIVSLCGSEYDTTLAVYHGSSCPTQPRAIQCSDDDCRDLESRIIVPVVQGQTYLVRVGGYDDEETGLGVLSIRCTVDGSHYDVCGQGIGDCRMPHRTAGCADVEYCEQQCDEDPSCCDVTWHVGCGSPFQCCVYSSRSGRQSRRCTSEMHCPRSGPGYNLRDFFPVSSCDDCGN